MKKGLLVLTFLFCVNVHAQLLFKLSSDTLKSFVYTDGDEFNSDRINTEYWKGAWTKANMAQDFRYNDANVKLDKGLVNFLMLKQDSVYQLMPHEIDSTFIRAKKISVQNYTYALNYSAGMIISRKKFHYGLYELKFKVEEGKGVWPAFWFFGGNKNEEIDAFELKGEKNDRVHVDMHCPEGCDKGYKNKWGLNSNYGGWLPLTNYLHDGFTIFLLEWRPDEILWYVNGYPLAYFKGSMPNPMNLFLNTQIAANGGAFAPGPDTLTKFPNTFYVDYIRVWQAIRQDSIPVLQKTRGDVNELNGPYDNKPVSKRGLMYHRKKFNGEEGLVTLRLGDNNKLRVLVLGKLGKSSAIYLKGKTKTYMVPNVAQENVIDLAEEEEQLELIIQTKAKEYKQSFLVQRQVLSLPGR